jgi:protease-4
MKKQCYYLEIKLADEIVEGRPDSTFFLPKGRLDIKTVLDALAKAKEDRKIVGLALKIRQARLGWARLQDIRDAVVNFKSSGKPVIAFMESGGNREYFLASAGSVICLVPSANLDLTGLSAEVLFFKGSLDRLGVKPDLARVGEYKSAVEMFTRDAMSPAYREELTVLLDDLYAQFIKAIADGRGLDAEATRRLVDGGPFTAWEAMDAKLVDKLAYEDEMEKIFEELVKSRLKKLPLDRYKIRESFFRRIFRRRRPRIALIHVVGTIASGENRRSPDQRSIVGSETLSVLIRAARENRNVKAIVLRVNSPGGSALASDVIWREVIVTREKKPVIVSFGDVAASGGYYIAAAADSIVAEPATVTGSIGVIGGKFVIRELLDKLGIKHESITRGAHAGFYSMYTPYSDEERQRLDKQIRDFYYREFIKKVATGRNMDDAEVEKIAQGRVWSGHQGKNLGLIDELGGLDRAIEIAKAKAGIPAEKKVSVVYYLKRRRWRDLIPRDFGFASQRLGAFTLLADLATLWELYQTEDVLALMPFDLRIR